MVVSFNYYHIDIHITCQTIVSIVQATFEAKSLVFVSCSSEGKGYRQEHKGTVSTSISS